MIRWKHLPIFLSALLCVASCNLGTSPGGGTEGEGLSGILQDPDGHVVAGALVRVFPEPRASLAKSALAAEAIFDSVYSDSRGRFTFDSLPDGHYGLRSYVKRGDTTLVLMLRQILYDGKKKLLGTHTLVVGGRLVMQVRNKTEVSNGSGERPPLAGTQCAVVGLPYVSFADSTGLCVIDALPPGQYAVRLSYPGFADVVTIPIEVRPGQSAGHGPWDLPPLGPVLHYPVRPATLAHWTFDARDTLTGEFPTVSGHDIPLLGYGAIPLNASPFGKAAAFNGTSYLATAKVEPGLAGKDARYLTLEARVRLTEYPSSANRDSSGVMMGTSHGYSLLLRARGGLAVQMTPSDSSEGWLTTAAWSSPGVVPLNQWVDVAVSIDRQTLQAYGFVNGTAVRLYNRNGLLPNVPDPKLPFYVGGFPGANRPFIGEIDEARVSDTLVFGAGVPLGRTDNATVYTPVYIQASADAGLSAPVPGSPDANGLADWNSGADFTYTVGTYDMASSYRAVARFPIPQGTTPAGISRAVIRMRVQSWVAKNVTGLVRIDAHRLLKSWKEGTGYGTGFANSSVFDGVTARERYYWTSNSSALWNKTFIGLDGVDASVSPAASAFVQPQSGTVLEWDVTDLAREWAADTTKNFGVVLVSPFPASNSAVMDFPRLHAREAVFDSLRPVLILNGAAAAAPQTTEVRFLPDADATISSSVPGNPDVNGLGVMNRGKEQAFGAATYDMAGGSRALVKFPMPAYYSPGRIVSAKVRFHSNGWTTKNTKRAYQIKVHRMLKSWKEGVATTNTPNSAAIDGVTARERFWGLQDGSEDWSEVLVGLNDVDASSAPTDSLTKPSGSMEAWEFDITPLARQWAADSSKSNFGILLASPFPASNAEAWDYPLFHSREAAVADSLKPAMILKISP